MTTSPLLLGVDVGTSQVKVGAFTPDGTPRSLHAAPTPALREGPQRAHHDPEALWATVARLLCQVGRDLTPGERGRLAALGISSFGESGVLVDARGETDRPVLAWFDDRPAAVLGEVAAVLDPAGWRARTGLFPDHTYGLPKLLWEARERSLAGLCWLSVADFIAFRLTGRRSMGVTQASRTLLLDLRTRGWMTEVLPALGLPEDVLPPLRAPGELLGKVTGEAAALTELPGGLPVWEGAHDQPCAAAGIGAVTPGITVNACGTAETLFESLTLPDLDRALAQPGVVVGPHALPGLAYAMTTLRASGSTLDWALRLCGGERERMLEEAARVPGGDLPVFFPHLRTLTDDPHDPGLPGGMFVGLRETHEPPHLIRSVLEGLSFELARLHDRLRAGTGTADTLRAVGGPTRSALWMRLKADTLNVPALVYEEPHATVWGAAWLAWRHLNAAGGCEVPPVQPQVRAAYLPGNVTHASERRRRYDALFQTLTHVFREPA